MDQLTDIHSAIINELNVLTTEYGSTIDLAISSVDMIRNSHWSQVDDLVSDHIASPIVIQNYFIPVSQSSILKWNTRRADWKKYSITFNVLTPYISSNPYIDIHLANILDAIQWAAELSVHKHTGNHYNRRINFLPQQSKLQRTHFTPPRSYPKTIQHWVTFPYVRTRHGVNSILSIPIPLNSIWSIPLQIYQFQFNSKIFNSNSVSFLPNIFFLPWVDTQSTYLEYILRVVYIPSMIVMEEIFLN